MPAIDLEDEGLPRGRDVRDVRLGDGRVIAPWRLARSGSPHALSNAGWRHLVAVGVRTIVDLRSPWEVDRHPLHPEHLPTELVVASQPLEPSGYAQDWADRGRGWMLGTPYYYPEFLAAHADRAAAVLRVVADAPPGGVLVHCSAGRDRTGLIVVLTLDLLGVDHDAIVDDHWQSFDPGPSPSPGVAEEDEAETRHHLTREQHRSALIDLLAARPGPALFADDDQRAEMTRRLADRLTLGATT